MIQQAGVRTHSAFLRHRAEAIFKAHPLHPSSADKSGLFSSDEDLIPGAEVVFVDGEDL
ncbi:hypothetical protein ACN20G_29760 (plasmid) [Streptomyces sp. BI20]|uniref:hypothetical protein n=1 Tax=Streptomyces sp. BI20 TaxID=3403460 RepID=UPI003C792AEB